MKVILESDEVRNLLALLHAKLFPDTPAHSNAERVIREEATLLLNLLLFQTVMEWEDEEYLDQCDWISEAVELLETFWKRRQCRILFSMNPTPRAMDILDMEGSIVIHV